MSVQPDVSAGRARRWRARWLLLLVCLLGAAVGTGMYLRRDRPAPLPVLDLAGVDPAVVGAIESARENVNQKPGDALAWGRLGMVLYANDFTAESAGCFLQARLRDPNELRWPYYRAVALTTADRDAALQELRLAVALCSDSDLMPRLRLADLLLEQEKVDEADEQYRQVLRQAPHNSLAHMGLARLAVQRNDDAAALEHLDNCLTDLATQKPARALRAALFHRRHDDVAAERERGLAALLPEPGSAIDDLLEEMMQLMVGQRAAVMLGNRLLRQRRVQEAVALLVEASRDYPESAAVWLSLGKAYLELNDAPAAENALRAALKHEPGQIDAHFFLGVALLDQGQTEQAGDCFQRAVELRPDYVRARCYLAHCLEKLGKRSEAIQAYRTALRYQPFFAHAHTNLANLLIRDQRVKEALEHLELAVSLDPEDKQARELLGKYRR